MTDPRTIRLVVLLLGFLAAGALGCATALTVTGHAADAAWTGFGGALGALAGILTSTRSTPDPTVGAAMEQAHAAGAAQTEAAVRALDSPTPEIPPV